MKIWSTAIGDVNFEGLNPDGTITIAAANISDSTATGRSLLTAADADAAAQVIAPSNTILSAAATAAIAALTGASTAADIVAALQAT